MYSIDDLGTLSGTVESVGLDINAGGQVVGYASLATGRGRRAFRWTKGALQEVGQAPAGFTYIEARAINTAGQAVGTMYNPFVSACIGHAFLWMEGILKDLGTLPGGFACGVATDINDTGQIVGYLDTFRNGESGQYATLWTKGVVQLLGPTGGASQAYGMNDAGQVVGSTSTTHGAHAFRWTKGVIQDLGTLGGATSTAYAISESGQVVGDAATMGRQQHAFLWPEPGSQGTMRDLDTLGGTSSIAFDINAAGQVVGSATTADGRRHAFVYTSATGIIDLNCRVDPGLGWTLVEARGINEGGQITGHGIHHGQVRAFRLTPR